MSHMPQHTHHHPLAPYSPPNSQSSNIHIQPGSLVAYEGERAITPPICVACGSTERGGDYVNRNLSWAPNWTVFTFLISPLLFFLFYLVTRKSLKTSYYMCPKCLNKHQKVRTGSAIGWGVLMTSIGATMLLGTPEIVMFSSLLVFLAMIPLGIMGRSPLKISTYQNGQFFLRARAHSYPEQLRMLGMPSHQLPHSPLPPAHTRPHYTPTQQPQPQAQPQPQPQVQPQAQYSSPDGTDGMI